MGRCLGGVTIVWASCGHHQAANVLGLQTNLKVRTRHVETGWQHREIELHRQWTLRSLCAWGWRVYYRCCRSKRWAAAAATMHNTEEETFDAGTKTAEGNKNVKFARFDPSK